MKYILICDDLNQIKKYMNYEVDAFVLSDKNLSLDTQIHYNATSIDDTIYELKKYNKEIFIDCKILIHQKDIQYLKSFLIKMDSLGVNFILYTDPAIYMLIKELKLNIIPFFSNDIFNTHTGIANFLQTINVNYSSLSREITKEELEVIIKTNKEQLHHIYEYQVFGKLRMFYTKRKLLDNFFQYLEINDYYSDKNHKLVDTKRDNFYNISQNIVGTHIFTGSYVCCIDELDLFYNSNIEYLTLNINDIDNYCAQIVVEKFLFVRELIYKHKNVYNKEINKINFELEQILKKYNIKIDKGFLYKPTIY